MRSKQTESVVFDIREIRCDFVSRNIFSLPNPLPPPSPMQGTILFLKTTQTQTNIKTLCLGRVGVAGFVRYSTGLAPEER